MKKDTQEFNAVYQKKGRWYMGLVEGVPGVNVQEKTLKEARNSIQEALSMVLDSDDIYAVVSKQTIREPILYRIEK